MAPEEDELFDEMERVFQELESEQEVENQNDLENLTVNPLDSVIPEIYNSPIESKIENDIFEYNGKNYPMDDSHKILMEDILIDCLSSLGEVSLTKSDHPRFIIHIPQLTIRDIYGNNRFIYDLLIRIDFSIVYGDSISGISDFLQGRRLTMTYLEQEASYRHSHLSKGKVLSGFDNFCRGSYAPMNIPAIEIAKFLYGYDKLKELLHNKSIEDIVLTCELFAINLKEYLEFESSDTNPYIRMSEIYSKLPTVSISFPESVVDNLVLKIIDSKERIPMSFRETNGYKYIDIGNIEDIINKHCPKNYKSVSIFGKNVDVSRVPENNIEKYMSDFRYNDETYKVKLIPEPELVNIENLPQKPLPELIDKVYAKLSEHFQRFYTECFEKINSRKKQPTSRETKRLPESNIINGSMVKILSTT